MEKEIFKQLEKITQLGLIAFVVSLFIISLCIYTELTDVEEESGFVCGVVSGEDSFSSAEAAGQALFLANCASCHNNNMIDDMTGPALAGTIERWSAYDGAIYQWIQNGEDLAKQGNPRAKMMLEWSEATMPNFENLDTSQIANILAYIEVKADRN